MLGRPDLGSRLGAGTPHLRSASAISSLIPWGCSGSYSAAPTHTACSRSADGVRESCSATASTTRDRTIDPVPGEASTAGRRNVIRIDPGDHVEARTAERTMSMGIHHGPVAFGLGNPSMRTNTITTGCFERSASRRWWVASSSKLAAFSRPVRSSTVWCWSPR